ncbi:MAG: ABC transporter ATP-binding protein, partial [Chloroflexota bacterium]|nr:ABC transporter ATP-binding protein [Chloroflexota bacterium]
MKAELVDVQFAYVPDKPILRGVSLALETGQCVGLMGPSGAGKSTLARHLNGLLRPSGGAVLLEGRDVRTQPVAALARHVGYVFQNPLHQLFAQTVREEVGLALTRGPNPSGRAEAERRVDEMLRALGLEDLASRHPLSVSEGQRKRIALAAVLAARPSFLILDEPTL